MTSEHGCSLIGRRLAVAGLMVVFCAGSAYAQSRVSADPATLTNPANIPDIRQLLPPAADAKGVSASLQILVLLTVLTLVPSILVMMTAFPRIVVVLALLRQAVGTLLSYRPGRCCWGCPCS